MKSSLAKTWCAVCGEKSDGSHFGAETCRACAAFFRRTVAFNREYRCRQNGDCEIEKPARCSCRACRYNKCVKMGMKMKGVQPNREPLGSQSNEPSTAAGNSKNINNKEPRNIVNLNDNMPCLWRIQTNYFQLYNIRRVMHKKEPVSVISREKPRNLNYKECNDQYAKEIGVTKNFLEMAFPEYKALDSDQQNVLFKNFYATFLLLEPGYFSQLQNRYDAWFLASGDMVDWENPESFFCDKDKTEFMTQEEAVQLYGNSFDVYKRNTLDSWSRFKITDIEFYALISFIVWEVGLVGQTVETEAIAEECRKNISRELVYYYLNVLNDSEYGIRLTNLMSLLQTHQRALRKWQEDTEIGQVFNAFGAGDVLYDIIMTR